MLLKWRWFPAGCTLAAGLLLKIGAPVIPTALGLVVAALFTWRTAHRSF
jgi:hypothetical protein